MPLTAGVVNIEMKPETTQIMKFISHSPDLCAKIDFFLHPIVVLMLITMMGS